MRLIGVIGHVPSRSLELNRGRRDHLLDAAAAFRTLLKHLVRKLLDFLELMTALFALIFVKRHGFRDSCEENSFTSILGAWVRLRQLRGGNSCRRRHNSTIPNSLILLRTGPPSGFGSAISVEEPSSGCRARIPEKCDSRRQTPSASPSSRSFD